MKSKISSKDITLSAVIAAIYVVLSMLQAIPMMSLTYGPIQIRLAEALTILPFVEKRAISGVFIGCFITNMILSFSSGFGLIDIIGGSLVTLLAAYLSSKAKNKYIAAVYPIVLNALIVSIWVSYFSNVSYAYTVAFIFLGEFISVGILGNIILIVNEKSRFFKRF